MARKNTVRRYPPVDYYDVTAVERWLERMALNGLFLVRVERLFAHFTREGLQRGGGLPLGKKQAVLRSILIAAEAQGIVYDLSVPHREPGGAAVLWKENGRSAQAVAIADLCGAVGPFCDIHQVELGSAAGGAHSICGQPPGGFH